MKRQIACDRLNLKNKEERDDVVSVVINLILPGYYERIESMKQNSFPYRRAMTRLLLALDNVQKNTGLGLYDIIGLIEAQCGTNNMEAGREQIKFAYAEKTPEAMAFLRGNSKKEHDTIKNIMRRILQMCVNLNANGYPSFDSVTSAVNRCNYDARGAFMPRASRMEQGTQTHDAAFAFALMPNSNMGHAVYTAKGEVHKNAWNKKNKKKVVSAWAEDEEQDKSSAYFKIKKSDKPVVKKKKQDKPADDKTADLIKQSEEVIQKLEKRNESAKKITDATDDLVGKTVETNNALSDFL